MKYSMELKLKHVTGKACFAILVASGLLLAGCAGGGVKMGSSSSKTTATGYAGGAQATGANSALEHCDKPIGTLSVYEDGGGSWSQYMGGGQTSSVVPVIRLLAQQSNCFVIVERGRAMNAMRQERALMQGGELRRHSNFGKGQMAAADYTVNPNLVISSNNVGGIGGSLGGLLPGMLGSIASSVGGHMKFKDAQSILTLVDNRSGVQVVAAEGSASASNAGAFLGALGSRAGGSLHAYTKTPEGKVIVGSMTDAYINMVKAVKSYKAQESASPHGHGTGGSLRVN